MNKMRLQIYVKPTNKFYYDIGLRENCKLSRTIFLAGERQPRFLEDFINIYGKNKIKIISYGKLINKKKIIDRLLE